MIMKILRLIQKNSSKAWFRRTIVVCCKYIWGSDECKYHLRKIGLLLLSLTLKTVFPAHKLAQNCYTHKHVFVLKTGNLIFNWVTLSFSYNLPMSQRLSPESNLPNCLVNWEKFKSAIYDEQG